MRNIIAICLYLISSVAFAEVKVVSASESEKLFYIYSGSDLLTAYREHSDKKNGIQYESGFYTGYVTGVVELSAHSFFCPPPRVTIGQYAAIAGKYIEEHPARLHLAAGRLVIEALAAEYPCKNKSAQLN